MQAPHLKSPFSWISNEVSEVAWGNSFQIFDYIFLEAMNAAVYILLYYYSNIFYTNADGSVGESRYQLGFYYHSAMKLTHDNLEAIY